MYNWKIFNNTGRKQNYLVLKHLLSTNNRFLHSQGIHLKMAGGDVGEEAITSPFLLWKSDFFFFFPVHKFEKDASYNQL